MKKFLVAVAALACMGSVALAGPNAGGTIFVQDANMVYTTDIASYCGLGTAPTSCAGADTVLESGGVSKVFKCYAAFLPGSSPRLKGMAWGVTYGPNVVLVAWGPCVGDLNNGGADFQGPGWPGNNTGDAIVFQTTQTSQLVEAYWFAGYNYYGTPGCFCVRDNPDPGLGGNFGDDSAPPQLDPIAGYGCLGFDRTCGSQGRCPATAPTGACCIGTVCSITTQADCQGTWMGPGTLCDPNPCLPTGACCIGTTCVVLTQHDCEGQGGTYMGDGVVCTETLCQPPPTGACCLPDHTCIVTTQADCQSQNGTWYEGQPCTDQLCVPVPVKTSTWGQIKANYR